ncbi:hypothetical protein WH96_06615 [Kiloniella spongiae]|uniref:Uncharacterized protein n=1 Tax=Kiloniella spongiae TaxID=1489064 RepID=A0A0H2MFH9_9PROT|nr:hypothetical protein [Kiloniella spongiae]KLN61319.1 hypothetical protein WH96_06615 [Kiloniella spongiae]
MAVQWRNNINAKTWLVSWSDGLREYLVKTDFDTAADMGNALQSMQDEEITRSSIYPWPKGDDKFKAVCNQLKSTTEHFKKRHKVFPDKTNATDWEMLFRSCGVPVSLGMKKVL